MSPEPEDWKERLERVLLGEGGQRVVFFGPEPHAAQLLARGRLFTEPIRRVRGERNRCHTNAAAMWGQDIDDCRLITGYALGDDLLWRSHSWVLSGGKVCETTLKQQKYFGVELETREALKFWVENFLEERYSGPTRLMRQVATERAKDEPDPAAEKAANQAAAAEEAS